MATDRIALLRPFNTLLIEDAIKAGDLGEGSWSVKCDIAAGTYWSFLAVLDAVQTLIQAEFPAATITINSSYKIVFTFATSQALAFDSTTTADYFGFEGNRTAATTHTAERKCPYFWISTYAPSDQTDFYWEQNEIWKGSQAMDGTWVGRLQTDPILAGNNLKLNKSVSLQYEQAHDVFFSMPVDVYDSYRALDYFVMMSRASTVASGSHSQCTGVQFFWDADDIITQAMWGDASTVHGAFTTITPYTFAYCTISPSGMRGPNPALPSGKTHYNVSLNLETASPDTSWIGW